MSETLKSIVEIEAKHAEILEKLDELDSRILFTLEEWTRTKEPCDEKESLENGLI